MNELKRALLIVAVLLAVVQITFAQSEQAERENVVIQIRHTVIGWHRQYEDRVPDYNLDVRKTNSLVTPYVGTLEFGRSWYITKCHKNQTKAEKDTKFRHFFDEYQLTFAYQERQWVKTGERVRNE